MTLHSAVIAYFLVFCRVGIFFLMAPGFSSERVPRHSRLYLSISLSLIIGFTLEDNSSVPLGAYSQIILAALIVHEVFAGLILGFISRVFIFAIESLITLFCYTIGLSNIFTSELLEHDASPALSTFVILASIQLLFITDLHHVLIQGIVHSYSMVSFGGNIHLSSALNDIVRAISQSYLVVLRLSSPFLIYAIIINFSFAFFSRLSPNFPIYFISGPIVVFLGLTFFKNSSNEFLSSLILSLRQLIVKS